MPTEAMTEKLAKGRAARWDYDVDASRRARRRESDRELQGWAEANFPSEKRMQAFVAAAMLRSIHGKGNVTKAMVRQRMEAHDSRFGLNESEGSST